jgi:hypothetical protein
MAQFDLRQFARLGAEVRVRQLQLELAAIYKVFPELRTKPTYTDDGQTIKDTTRRRRRKMGAAERKAVSLRMRKYWAARRKAKAQA